MWVRREERERQPAQSVEGRLSHPLVLGHRGASAIELENTVAAFERARADGADGVELDVLRCGSGEVVVFHDDDLVRLAHRPERIATTPLSVLRQIELGPGSGIPTLEEAIEACGPTLLVNIELKAAGLRGAGLTSLVERVAAIVARMGVGPRVLVSSFNPWAVRCWMRRAPAVRAGLLFEGPSPVAAWAAAWLRPFALNPDVALCRPDRVARWRRRGYFLSVWTVDDPGLLRVCRDLGVDAVITNDPARARAALSVP